MIILTLPQRQAIPLRPNHGIWTHVEYRVDYLTDPLSVNFLKYKPNDIICWRNPSDLDAYTRFIEYASIHSAALIDVDASIMSPRIECLLTERHILSLHLHEFDHNLISTFLSKVSKVIIKKISFRASSWHEVEAATSIIDELGLSNVLVSVTGPLGKLQRILFKHTGSCGVYIHGGESTAEGQLSFIEAEDCRIHTEDIEAYYAIVGHTHVDETLSFARFNKLFCAHNIKAVLLPLPAMDVDSALYLLSYVNRIKPLLGLVLTNPLKSSLTSKLAGRPLSANTIAFAEMDATERTIPPLRNIANTDVYALRDCLNELSIPKQACILIYGSGATACTFADYLSENGYSKVAVCARNRLRGRQAAIHAGVEVWDENIPCVDLLINCTPFGSSDKDSPHSLPCFLNLIDLPYATTETILAAKSRIEGIPCVDGRRFWEIQHRYQCLFFGLPILSS